MILILRKHNFFKIFFNALIILPHRLFNTIKFNIVKVFLSF